jgi:hypothetical protein
MSAGTKTSKDFTEHSIDMRNTLLPSIQGLADGTYCVSIVVASGVPTLVLTEPASDQTIAISGLTSFSIKNGCVTAKA